MINTENCPMALQSNAVNTANHLITIRDHGLGPADPREMNTIFWQDKATKWQVSEGDARGRLCANCEHYLSTTKINECIINGPAINLKASDLPLEPKWADIESRPTAFCTLYEITCSPIRTCDSQEMGGPIDDLKLKAIESSKAVQESGIDSDELEDYLNKSQQIQEKAMYSKTNVPQWASKKSAKVREVAIRIFNETFRATGSEDKARIASLAAMQNAEEAEKKSKKVMKTVEDIIKSKYNLE